MKVLAPLLVAAATERVRVEGPHVVVTLRAGESLIAAKRGLVDCVAAADQVEPLMVAVRDTRLEVATSGPWLARLLRRLRRRRLARVDLRRIQATTELTVRLAPARPGWSVFLLRLDDDQGAVVRRQCVLAAVGVKLADNPDGLRCEGPGTLAIAGPGVVTATKNLDGGRVDVDAARAVAWCVDQHPPKLAAYAGARWRSFNSAVVYSASALDEPAVVVLKPPRVDGRHHLRPIRGTGLAGIATRLATRLVFVLLAFLALAFSRAGFSLGDTPARAIALALWMSTFVRKLARAFNAATTEFRHHQSSML
ncbi:hypothetical protein CTAYLR_000449 [Chrysophaeum taylorii]|uniref:Uncharacterized protein n=1 Tax=Chrysophaeum taylorii TaxID=2483200 RepID=A0AAD7XLU7_9STRA|nr:hypothetical protein CTAYLR_000449 [Chrysophaeum taylorii]